MIENSKVNRILKVKCPLPKTSYQKKNMIKIKQVETFVYRYPLETPVQTSFGIMTDRPMVIVKLTDQDDVVGFGKYGVITRPAGPNTERI